MKAALKAVRLIAVLVAAACAPLADADAQRIYDVEIVNEWPHDPDAFTQGLFFHEGALYESTGQYGQSRLRQVDLETGEILQETAFPDEVFGEGIAPWNGRIIALTWRAGRGFVFDKESFETVHTFSYPGEGWGLTEDGERLIMSDGTPTLRFLDPDTLEETGRVEVRWRGEPLSEINELEWIDGEVFANIWRSDAVARIDPETGEVVALIDMRPLRAALGPNPGRAEVLNGIAWDRDAGRLFATGKYWPKLFEIKLIERGAHD